MAEVAGWHVFNHSGASGNDVLVYVRYVERDGRLVPDGVVMHGDTLAGDDLRVSLRRSEAQAQRWWRDHRGLPAASDEGVEVGGFRPGTYVDWFYDADHLPDVGVEYARAEHDKLRTRGPVRAPRKRRSRRKTPRANRPDGTDGFYRLVATTYNEYAEETRAPGREIADEFDVPITTAHRWVREARRRGFLPPGRKGAAG